MPGKGARSKSVPKERSGSVERGSPIKLAPLKLSTPPPQKIARSPSPSRSPHSNRSLGGLNLDSPCSEHGHSSSEKCRCQLCTCGKHHCPKQHESIPFAGTTTSGTTFKGHDNSHFPERARAPMTLHTGVKSPASHFSTTHTSTYIEHENNHYIKPHDDKMERSTRPLKAAPRDKFDHTTSHQNDFAWPDASPPTRASRTLTHTPFGGNSMDFSTTYSNQYIQKEREEIKNNFKPTAEYDYGSPRDFTTTNKSYHDAKDGRPASPSRKPKSDYNYGSPRDFTTTNKSYHDEKQISSCPASLLPHNSTCSAGHVKNRASSVGKRR